MQTIELLPDDAFALAVRAIWRRLSHAGLPSFGAGQAGTDRPYVTLAVVDGLPARAMLAKALTALPLTVRTAGVLAHGGAHGALALPFVPTPALVGLHAAVWQTLAKPVPRHAPGRWTPHIGLALRMTPAERAAAVRALADVGDIEGTLVAARTYDTDAAVHRALP